MGKVFFKIKLRKEELSVKAVRDIRVTLSAWGALYGVKGGSISHALRPLGMSEHEEVMVECGLGVCGNAKKPYMIGDYVFKGGLRVTVLPIEIWLTNPHGRAILVPTSKDHLEKSWRWVESVCKNASSLIQPSCEVESFARIKKKELVVI